MIKAETEPKGQLVFVETLPWRILGSNISPKHMNLVLWTIRSFGLLILIPLPFVILAIPNWRSQEYIATFLAFLSVFMILFQTEVLWREQRRAANPMKVYENGVEIWISPYERLFGRNSWIPKDNIEEVEVLRYQTIQNLRSKETIRWKKAPIELVIHMKNGRKRLTGSKLPVGIMEVATLMNEMWGVRIKDSGEGMGMAVPFVFERAKIGWWHRY